MKSLAILKVLASLTSMGGLALGVATALLVTLPERPVDGPDGPVARHAGEPDPIHKKREEQTAKERQAAEAELNKQMEKNSLIDQSGKKSVIPPSVKQ